MTDSIAVVESSRNAGSVESEVQSWLDDNAANVASIDHTGSIRRGSNSVLVLIWYTAA